MTMLKNILVPLDGTALAEASLPYARALAGRTGARLTLVRAAHYTALLGDVAADQHRAIERAEDYLTRLVEKLSADGYDAHAGVPFGGSTAEWIVEECDVRHADLVIMATHDRIGIDRLVHGSIAEAVVHRSSVPVMLVRGVNAEQLAQRYAEQQPVFVVPLDGSHLAEAALPAARALARTVGGSLVLVGVTPRLGQLIAEAGGIVAYSATELGQLEASVRAYLEGVAHRDVAIEVRSGDPATEIADVAREYSAAAVVMATHGRTGVARSILGSVAGGVVHYTQTPVVLVHAGALKVHVVEQAVAAPAD